MPENTLGERLRKARIVKRLFISDVAKQASINEMTLGNWELDKHMPNKPGELKRVADILEVSVGYLLGPLSSDAGLSEKLVYYRWLQGWTQKELAEKMGVDQSYLGKAERGRNIKYIKEKAVQLDKNFFAG